MITELVTRFDANRKNLHAQFLANRPDSYKAILQALIVAIASDDYADDQLDLDVTRITAVDHGDYQGTILFVIAAKGYQPSRFWTTMVGYGSCSGCDTLQAISDYSSDAVTDSQANGYVTLALHLLQQMKAV